MTPNGVSGPRRGSVIFTVSEAHMLKNDLAGDLRRMRLPAMADNLDLRIREAEEGKIGRASCRERVYI